MSACYLKDFILAVPLGKHVRNHEPLARTPEACHLLVDHEPLWSVLLILATFRKLTQPLPRPCFMFSLLLPPRRPTTAAGVLGVLGAPAPEPAAVACSSPSASATTRRRATTAVTARARGPSTAPAASRRAHRPVSADQSPLQPSAVPTLCHRQSLVLLCLLPLR